MLRNYTPPASAGRRVPDRVDRLRVLFLARGIDLWDVLPAPLWKHRDEAALVLHKIITGSACSDPEHRWAPLSCRQGAILCGGNNRLWQALRAILLEAGIIEHDGVYEVGVKCYDYRLTAPWEARGIDRYTPTDPDVTVRLAKLYEKIRGRSSKSRSPVAEFLEGWVRLLELDETEADRAIANIERPESRWCAEVIAAIIQHGDPCDRVVHFCDHGRLHSIVTRTPRVLRAAFRIGGEPLVEVNVRNCQPLLLGKKAAAWAMSNGTTSEGGRRATRRGGAEGGGGGRRAAAEPSSIPYGSANLHDCMLPPDLSEYIHVCESGYFYEELASTLTLPCSCSDERDKIKDLAMWLLFGDVPSRHPYLIAFSARWPTVASRLAALKRGDHRRAAHALQRAESDLMIRGVCVNLMERYPDMPLLTIHDALLVPHSGVGHVVEVIRHVWARAGVSPTLKYPESA